MSSNGIAGYYERKREEALRVSGALLEAREKLIELREGGSHRGVLMAQINIIKRLEERLEIARFTGD